MRTRFQFSHVLTAAALVAAAVTFGSGCGGSDDDRVKASAARTDTAPRAAADAPVASAGPRRPPARLEPPGRAGEVRIEDGPFTDRVETSALRVRRGERPRVTGRLLTVTDVSELLLLELQADFYDRRGRYLASGKALYEEAEPAFEDPLRFAIRADEAAPRAVAAILTIPSLVNE